MGKWTDCACGCGQRFWIEKQAPPRDPIGDGSARGAFTHGPRFVFEPRGEPRCLCGEWLSFCRQWDIIQEFEQLYNQPEGINQ